MFQCFSATSSPDQGADRLRALRDQLAKEGLTGFLVPRADAHQGENVAPCDERLSWLTGFTGSAGFCAALRDVAGVFIDGRYTLQVVQQVDTSCFTPVKWPATDLATWLTEHLGAGDTIGFDPWLHTVQDIRKLTEKLALSGISPKPTPNLVDAIWQDRPGRPIEPISTYPIELSGKSAPEKVADLCETLRSTSSDFQILTLPDSVCWLLNIRGSDIPHTPVVQGFAVVAVNGKVDFFTNATVSAEVADHLGPHVTCHAYSTLAEHLSTLSGKTVSLDPASAPYAVMQALAQARAQVVEASDPCILPKARKSAAEITATAEAHLRDGAAMAEFLCWLDRAAPTGGLTEIDVVQKLEGFRRATNALREISFDTICGAGPNGAIVHYRVTEDTNRPINAGELLLIDSGGQYLDGTTDITRTISIGDVGEDEKTCFTRVLQGMISMSRACWPKGLAGRDLDALARMPLWQVGQDYDHGTGHGVGVYLSVHEGPARLSRTGEVALEPGMILSNEPGYYRAEKFGIRIENLMVVETADDLTQVEHRDILRFKTLTYVPIDRALIKAEMLSSAERDWLNAYHRDTLDWIGPRVSPSCLDWLTQACAPI